MSDLSDELVFKVSTYSADDSCIEVGQVVGGSAVVMRHRRDPRRVGLAFTPHEWEAFVRGVKDGEFDVPVSCEEQ